MKHSDLRGILRYIPKFRRKIFVVSVDGGMVEDDNFGNLLMDVAVLRSLNIRVVLVHGAAAQIEKLATERGITPSNLDGAGITSEETLDVAVAASNQVTHELLEQLATHDLYAAHTNAVIAHPAGILKGVDQEFTGKVERIESDFLTTLLDNGIIPVVSPLGFDGEGATYRVNSDAVAYAVARELKAAKLVFVTDREGLVANGEIVRQIQASELRRLLKEEVSLFDPVQVSKAKFALQACLDGVPRVHIISGREKEGLLAEVFSNEGIGTLIFDNEYRQIRPATRRDVSSIMNFAMGSMENEELVERTHEGIEESIEDFHIYEIDANPVACVALHVYADDNCGELACLCVSNSHENRGIGTRLVQYVEQEARKKGLSRLLALSTQTFAFFRTKSGFTEAGVEVLPEERKASYEASGRNSRILVKELE